MRCGDDECDDVSREGSGMLSRLCNTLLRRCICQVREWDDLLGETQQVVWIPLIYSYGQLAQHDMVSKHERARGKPCIVWKTPLLQASAVLQSPGIKAGGRWPVSRHLLHAVPLPTLNLVTFPYDHCVFECFGDVLTLA